MDLFMLPVSRIFRFPQWVQDSLPRTRTACLPQNESTRSPRFWRLWRPGATFFSTRFLLFCYKFYRNGILQLSWHAYLPNALLRLLPPLGLFKRQNEHSYFLTETNNEFAWLTFCSSTSSDTRTTTLYIGGKGDDDWGNLRHSFQKLQNQARKVLWLTWGAAFELIWECTRQHEDREGGKRRCLPPHLKPLSKR